VNRERSKTTVYGWLGLGYIPAAMPNTTTNHKQCNTSLGTNMSCCAYTPNLGMHQNRLCDTVHDLSRPTPFFSTIPHHHLIPYNTRPSLEPFCSLLPKRVYYLLFVPSFRVQHSCFTPKSCSPAKHKRTKDFGLDPTRLDISLSSNTRTTTKPPKLSSLAISP
jgi:hypothetical protein